LGVHANLALVAMLCVHCIYCVNLSQKKKKANKCDALIVATHVPDWTQGVFYEVAKKWTIHTAIKLQTVNISMTS